ncbi:hypothetical protein ElyMa_000118000 [Elysia marginata]|uniref:Uncharacterized protein n=1 Tax=Elysia marginata TaxID=1093978 RepID=A0AAV4ELT2_9GAST|nr:hypothetical protein ElyMa_000118000 [Elysia marginata]
MVTRARNSNRLCQSDADRVQHVTPVNCTTASFHPAWREHLLRSEQLTPATTAAAVHHCTLNTPLAATSAQGNVYLPSSFSYISI